jgi:hypothetical protein
VGPNTDVYPRPEWNESERDKYVADLIDRLHELERKTNPTLGARSAKGKDRAASHALRIAGDLVNALAGWALDHQAGLALKDLKSVQLRTAEAPAPDRAALRTPELRTMTIGTNGTEETGSAGMVLRSTPSWREGG